MGVKVQLKDFYFEHVVPSLTKELEYKNIMQVPKLDKIVINIGDGELHENQKLLDSYVNELMMISGRKPVINKARRAISNFKLRAGMAVGLSVTLRGDTMWEFMNRLVSVYIPRIRDFRGLPDKSFDGRGNYSFGVKEQVIFTEIDYDKVEKMHGLDISIVTTAKSDRESYALLKLLGMPFIKRKEQEN
ncbi:MAG: 50S ribosomal protein L5 [Candidatus Delongbacteria bacterium]|nr:50S ribosomal protein L5 [Candidatus Delongbacteria bacterium]